MKDNLAVLKRLMRYIAPHKGYVALAAVSAVMSVAATLAAPVFIGDAIDHIIEKGLVEFDTVAVFMILLGVTIAVGAIFQWTL